MDPLLKGARQRRFYMRTAALLLSTAVLGCHSNESSEFIGVAAGLLNYTDEDVYLTIKSPARTDISTYLQMGKRAGGGADVCCAALPEKWRPGIKVQVDYRYGNRPNQREYSKMIEIPPYPDGVVGPLFISVLSEDEVEVISSIYGPRAAEWPGKMTHLP